MGVNMYYAVETHTRPEDDVFVTDTEIKFFETLREADAWARAARRWFTELNCYCTDGYLRCDCEYEDLIEPAAGRLHDVKIGECTF